MFAFFIFLSWTIVVNSLADWASLRWRVLSETHRVWLPAVAQGVKNPCSAGDFGFDPWVGKVP